MRDSRSSPQACTAKARATAASRPTARPGRSEYGPAAAPGPAPNNFPPRAAALGPRGRAAPGSGRSGTRAAPRGARRPGRRSTGPGPAAGGAARRGDELGTKRGGRGARSSGGARLPTSGRDRAPPGRERRAAEPRGDACRASSESFRVAAASPSRRPAPGRSAPPNPRGRRGTAGPSNWWLPAVCGRSAPTATAGGAVRGSRSPPGSCGAPRGRGSGYRGGSAHPARWGRAAALRSEPGAGSSRRLQPLCSLCGRFIFRIPAVVTSRAVRRGALVFQAGLPSRRIAEKYLPCSAKLRGPARWCCSICGRRLPLAARTSSALRSRDGLLPGHGHGRAGSGGEHRRSDGLSRVLRSTPSSPSAPQSSFKMFSPDFR